MPDPSKFEIGDQSTRETSDQLVATAADLGQKMLEGVEGEVPAGAIVLSNEELQEFKGLDPKDPDAISSFCKAHGIPEESAFWVVVTDNAGNRDVRAYYSGVEDFAVRVESTYVPGFGYLRRVGLNPETLTEMSRIKGEDTQAMDAVVAEYHLHPELGSKVAVISSEPGMEPVLSVVNISHGDFGTIFEQVEQ